MPGRALSIPPRRESKTLLGEQSPTAKASLSNGRLWCLGGTPEGGPSGRWGRDRNVPVERSRGQVPRAFETIECVEPNWAGVHMLEDGFYFFLRDFGLLP